MKRGRFWKSRQNRYRSRRPIDRDTGVSALALLLRSTLAELLTAEHIQGGHAGHRRHGCRNSARPGLV